MNEMFSSTYCGYIQPFLTRNKQTNTVQLHIPLHNLISVQRLTDRNTYLKNKTDKL